MPLSKNYSKLINKISSKIEKLIQSNGVNPDFIGGDDKFLDLRKYEYIVSGEMVCFLNNVHFYNEDNNQFNFYLVESELERLCEIIDDLT